MDFSNLPTATNCTPRTALWVAQQQKCSLCVLPYDLSPKFTFKLTGLAQSLSWFCTRTIDE